MQALNRAGAKLDEDVRSFNYATDIEEYCRCVDMRYEAFSNPLPTNTPIGMSRLVYPGMVVEVEAAAIIDQERLQIP